MKVKICGITNLEDALVAAEAGADFLGFIFYPPSKRAITVEAARDIVVELRKRPFSPMLVGVFVNETAETILHTLHTCQLDLAQLSGEEVPFLVADPRSPIYGRSYKALRPASYAEAEADAEWYAVSIQYSVSSTQLSVNSESSSLLPPSLLIDTHHPNLKGGTGQTGDWAMSAKLAQKVPGLMLAGGLTAENVAQAVQQVQPYAVDVASGVEAAPGQKDHHLVKTFIRNAKLHNSSFIIHHS